ncbi:MAG TPA: right-handed parallel beta-helix repeat-containing protein [Pyrinomonadaceae bacterium]
MPIQNNVISDANFGTVISQINTTPPATPQNYIFNTNLTISGNIVVPAKLILEPIDGARFVAANSTSTITFEGVGLAEDCLLGQQAVFSGFADNKVKFVGTEYPRHISERLFDATSISNRLRKALYAFKHDTDWTQNKVVTIRAYSGNIDSVVILRRYAILEIAPGAVLTNTFHDFDQPGTLYTDRMSPILFEGDNYIYGHGSTSVIHGSNQVRTHNGAKREAAAVILEPVSQFPVHFSLSSEYGSGGAYPNKVKNVWIEKIHFQGPYTRTNQEGSPAVSLGSCENGHIFNCSFDNWDGYSANIGKSGNSIDDVAVNCSIRDCVVTRSGYHVFAMINGVNCSIHNNKASKMGNVNFNVGAVTATTGLSTITIPEIDYHSDILHSAFGIANPWAVFTHTNNTTGKRTIWRTYLDILSRTSIYLKQSAPGGGWMANPIPSDISSTTGTVKLELVRQGGHLIDIEPNTSYDIVDTVDFTNNTFDCSESKMDNVFGIEVQGSYTATGCRNVVIRGNKIIGAYPSSAGTTAMETWIGRKGAYLAFGIYVWDAENCEITDNTIQGAINQSLWIDNSYGLTVKNNRINNHYPNAAPRAVLINNVVDSIFEGNTGQIWQGFSGSKIVWENLGHTDIPTEPSENGKVTISGAVLTRVNGVMFRWWHVGRPIVIGGNTYTIQSVQSFTQVTLTTSPSSQGTNGGNGFSYLMNLSGNKFKNNDWNLSKSSNSTSIEYSFVESSGGVLASAGYFQMTNTETTPLSLPHDTLVTVPIGTLTGNVTTYSIANNKLAVNEEGIYSLSGGIRLSGTTGGGRTSLLLRRVEPTGGEPIVIENEQNISDGLVMDIVFNFTFISNGTQEFYLELYQNSGATRTASRVTPFSGHFRLVKIGEA